MLFYLQKNEAPFAIPVNYLPTIRIRYNALSAGYSYTYQEFLTVQKKALIFVILA